MPQWALWAAIIAGLAVAFGSPWAIIGRFVKSILEGDLTTSKALEDERLNTAAERRDKEYWRDVALRAMRQGDQLMNVADTTNEILKSLPLPEDDGK